MKTEKGNGKTFLFLQGPHGPFFRRLSDQLRKTGAKTWRIGFNAGDQAFWPEKHSYLPFHGTQVDWADWLDRQVQDLNVSDIVLYGDTRPVHAIAIERAKAHNLTIHVFEEGYLRPYWITYERDGSNGHSRLMDMSVPEIRARLNDNGIDIPEVPAHWGDMRQHIFYGAVYHWFVLTMNRRYSNFAPHRSLTVSQEFRLYIRRLILMPWFRIERWIATNRVRFGGFPYHLALLQLEHDASFQAHSDFETLEDFSRTVLEGFAAGGPSHHHLVFKAHPLDDGRAPVQRDIMRIAKELGLQNRVHFIRGGKLARLLDHARSAVAINSTAAQQALWRGLPTKAFGSAVYSKPEFVSQQPITEFFANPTRPDLEAYQDYRRFLLETSQITGGYYSKRGRRQALRQVVDLMLLDQDPYDAAKPGTAAPRQQFRIVS